MPRTIIPYDPKLKQLARKLRNNMTLSEVVLWNELKNKKLMGYDFDRQRPIGCYIVDFYCKDLHLAIEVDGTTHFEEGARHKDLIRQTNLESMKVSFLRFDGLDVINKVGNVLEEIKDWIKLYEARHEYYLPHC